MHISGEKENFNENQISDLMIADGLKIGVAVLLILVFLAVFILTFYFFLQLEIQYGKRKVARKVPTADATNDIRTDDSSAITDSGTVSAENPESMKENAKQAGRRSEGEQVGDEAKRGINLGESKSKFEAGEKALISAEVRTDSVAGSVDASGKEINSQKGDGKNESDSIKSGTQPKEAAKGSAPKDERQSDGRDGVRAPTGEPERRKSLNLKSMRSIRSLKSNVDYTQPPKLPEKLLFKGQKPTMKTIGKQAKFSMNWFLTKRFQVEQAIGLKIKWPICQTSPAVNGQIVSAHNSSQRESSKICTMNSNWKMKKSRNQRRNANLINYANLLFVPKICRQNYRAQQDHSGETKSEADGNRGDLV